VNIVFNTYPFAFATPGGGEIQLLQYFRNLDLKGVSVSKFDLWKGFEQFGEESVIHFFSCMPGSVHFLHSCTQRNIPVVVSPNLWVTEETAHQYPFDDIRAALNVADAVVCNSNAECDLLARVFGLAREKFFTVYNAVDEVFLEPVSPEIFREAFDIRGKFVLNVANIETRKNQLALVQAMKQFPDMTLIVAGHVRDQAYAELCAVLGGAQWRHVGSLPHASELLRSAYAACEVFALPSTLETPGLAALEAAACGCRLVVTNEGSTTEYFRDEAVYADPNDVDSIASAIQRALESPRGGLRPRMASQYVWPLVMQQLIPVYEALLAPKRAIAGFFAAQGVHSEGFNEVEYDAEGAFVWSRASSSMQMPGGLVVWRWWSLADIEVDLLVDGTVVRQGVRVGPSWAWLCLDLPVDSAGVMQTLEIRVRGDALKVGEREPGVMLRDLLHLGATNQMDARRENWCLAHGFFFEAAGVEAAGFHEFERDEEGAFVWSRAEASMQVPGGLVAWRWWSLAETEVDLLVDGALVRQGVRVGRRWSWFCLDLPMSAPGTKHTLEIRLCGDTFNVDGRELGVMLRDLVHLGEAGQTDARRENWCLSHGLFFETAGMEASGFHAYEQDAEGIFVWSRASSSILVPGGLVAWRWWSLADIEVDLLVDGAFVRQGMRVGPSWAWSCLDLPMNSTRAKYKLEIRLHGAAFNVDGRELGVMLRDLVHWGEAGQTDARREEWCLARGLLFEAAGVQGEGFYPVEHDERGFFVWSHSEFQLRLSAGRVRIDGFVAQKCRVSLGIAGCDEVLLVVDLDVGESRLVFDLPKGTSGQVLSVNGVVEKLGPREHADPRDLGFAIRSVKIKKSINNEVGKKMRIVIDLQGAQTDSRLRGVGRYSVSLAKAMVRNGLGHEFYIVLNGLFPDTIEPLRAEFEGLVPRERIRVWEAAGPVQAVDSGNDWRRQAAELIREAFIQSLKPDFVHISSMMEGLRDNGVHSIGRAPHPFPVAATFYDVIPLIQREVYLDADSVLQKPYYEKLEHFERADLLLAISESSRREAIEHLYAGPDAVVNVGAAAEDCFRVVSVLGDFKRSMYEKFGIKREFIMYSGAADARKNQLGLIKAYFVLPEHVRRRYQLVLVGGLPAEYKARFREFSKELFGAADDVVITDRVSDEELVALYNLCALYVFPSWHEGFGLPALEAMACGAPVIGSATTSIPEVLGREDVLFDPHSPHAIAAKIEQVLSDEALLQDLRKHGPKQASLFSWDISARKALSAMERWHESNGAYFRSLNNHAGTDFPPRWLFPKISRLPGFAEHQSDWAVVQDRIAHSRWRATRYLFVDVSELVQRDARSGIQRVVRAVLQALFRNPPQGFRVMPVYATTDCLGYRYASDIWRKYSQEEWVPEGFIDFCACDVFFGLDMQHHVVIHQREIFDIFRKFGVEIHFQIYDLLPILSPEYFPAGLYDIHCRWLQVLTEVSDGLVCISRTVADDLEQWVTDHPPARVGRPAIGWAHIGADLLQSAPSMGLPDNAERILKAVGGSVSFLSVSTIEPRKGHAQLLDAADVLWKQGKNICLVFVGKPGWSVDSLVERIEGHRYFGERLFWLKGISDEYLDLLYKEADCLVSASYGEGFGLPIVEAALKNMPLIVRDIPVFREVAGDGAVYFSGKQPEDLAAVMETWLKDHEAGRSLPPEGVQVLSWDQSTKRLMEVVLGAS